jgi:hypothetical protein
MRLLVIGGSDAGIAAALRAGSWTWRLRPLWSWPTPSPNFSICGLPLPGRGLLTGRGWHPCCWPPST